MPNFGLLFPMQRRQPALFAAGWLILMLLYVKSGFTPDRFVERVGNAATTYPYREVLSFCAISTFELVAIYLIVSLRFLKNSWNRLSIAIALFFPWFLINFEFVAHASPVFGMHTLWLLVVNVSICLIALRNWFDET